MWRRITPALVLVFLTPFVGEVLLGDFPPARIFAYLAVLPMYGGGALFVRELARRAGRGWPAILALGLGYAVVEEGLGDMTLFTPTFMGVHLLAPGSLFGIGFPWWFYVLTLHVVWSVGTSVGLTEALFARRGTGPWLGRVGFAVSGVVFVLGTVLVHFGAGFGYHLKAWQILLSLALIAASVVVAFLLPRPRATAPAGPEDRPSTDIPDIPDGLADRPARRAPGPWLVGLGSLVLATGFQLFGNPFRLHWYAVPVDLALYLAAAVLVSWAARRAGWGPAHRFALVAGTTLTYCWLGVTQTWGTLAGTGAQALYILIAVALLVLAGRAVRTGAAVRPAAVSPTASTAGSPAGR